jgi:hypothetical protein
MLLPRRIDWLAEALAKWRKGSSYFLSALFEVVPGIPILSGAAVPGFSITKIFKIYRTMEINLLKICRRFSRKYYIICHYLGAAECDKENRSEKGGALALGICVISCKIRHSSETLQYYLSQLWASIVIRFSSVHINCAA